MTMRIRGLMWARPLDGRVAIVTGSTSGIGLAVAASPAESGAMIVLNGLGDAAEIDNLVRVLGARHGVPVRHDATDMSRPDAIAAMVQRTAGHFGPVDILVNNAGIQHVAPIVVSPTYLRSYLPTAKYEANRPAAQCELTYRAI